MVAARFWDWKWALARPNRPGPLRGCGPRSILRKLTRRGLRGVKLVIPDAHKGIKAAVTKVLCTSWQRCPVHFMRNVLACMTFLREHRAKLHSTNPIERLNGEIKRRTEVVGIFPNDAAITRLVGALLREQNDEWAVRRAGYMTLETMVPLSDDPMISMPIVAR